MSIFLRSRLEKRDGWHDLGGRIPWVENVVLGTAESLLSTDHSLFPPPLLSAQVRVPGSWGRLLVPLLGGYCCRCPGAGGRVARKPVTQSHVKNLQQGFV